jgi:hypothetical protein
MATLPTKQATTSSNGLKAFGRSLGDFQPLKPAEQKLLDACRKGEIALIDTLKRPIGKLESNEIRPGFVRFLLLGGDHETPVHERGVQIVGAWIDGTLELESCKCTSPLYLSECKVNGDFYIVDATIPKIILADVSLNSFDGDRLRTPGSIHFVKGCNASGEIRLPGASIGGDLYCTDGHFESSTGSALDCFGITIGGDVYLNKNFQASGSVNFGGANIGGDANLSGAKITVEKGRALAFDGATIGQDISLISGFHAKGEVSLIGVIVGKDLYFNDATFENSKSEALCCERITIRGSLFFRNVKNIVGSVNFTGANVNSIVDDIKSWALPTDLQLDGFRYERFGGGTTTASKRINWLKQQTNSHLDSDFRPQPWEQLIKVLREMGHDEDARAVAIEKQRMLYVAGKIEGLVPRLLHNAYGELSSYGYGPLRTVWWIVGAWLLCAFLYWNADQRGILAPSSPIIHAN